MSLSASVAPDEQQADQEQHVVAVPELGPEAPDPGEQQADDQHRRAANQPTKLATSSAVSLEPERVDLLDVVGGRAARRCRTMTSPWQDLDHDRGDGLGGRGRAPASVSSALNDEFGDDERADELGGERPLGLVEAAGHPARRAGVRVSATSVSRSSRPQRARRGRARPRSRTIGQRAGVERRRASSARRRSRSGDGGLEQGRPLVAA